MRTKTVLIAIWSMLGLLGLAAGDDSPKEPKGTTRSAEVQGAYRLGPEDVLEVYVWNEPDLTSTPVVRPDGKISLRLIGEFVASGKTIAELEEEIQVRLRKMLTDPRVNVILKEVNFPKIFVLGQVRKPDQFKIANKMSVLDAIALAGGFTDFAKRDQVIVIRGTQRIKVDVKRQVEDEKSTIFYLQQSDTVYVK